MQTITLNPGEELRIVGADVPVNNAKAPKLGNSLNSLVGGKRGSRKNRTERKTRKNQAGGKRGANPFMKFAAKERKNIMNQNPGMPVTEVGKELGKRWRALSDAEKSKY